MRNFFEQQERARRNTVWLVALFAIAVLALAAGVYFAALHGLRYPGLRPPEAEPPSTSLWDAEIFLSFFVGTLVIIILASLMRMASLRGGGSAVAEMLGGRLVAPGTADLHERRFLNVVEEMALASSVPVPQVFVLDGEEGINAFAAGHSPDDAAVIATRGCLEKLNRNELQGVIAHEFSHVLNGDMRLKLRLMGIIFGILVIGVVGRGMLRITHVSSRGSRSGKGGGAFLLALVAAGVALTLLGYIGLFCGRLIKAAVSRQREFLADASAVQFTRDPHGIAGALKKIGGYHFGSKVKASAAEETSHFFFSSAVSYPVFGMWFATHPPLEERIRRIDPAFDGRFPEVAEAAVPVEGMSAAAPFAVPLVGTAAAAGAAAVAAGVADPGGTEATTLEIDARDITRQVGDPRPEHARYAATLLRQLPAPVQQAVRDGFSACALIYAMLLSDDRDVSARQAKLIRAHSGARLLKETWRLAAMLAGFDPRWRLPVVKMAMPVLRQLTPDQQQRLAETVWGLIDADAQLSVFEFAISRTVLRSLMASRGERGKKRTYRTLDPVLGDCRVLLSSLARFGHGDEAGAQRAFAAGAKRLAESATQSAAQSLSLLEASACSLRGVDTALDRLCRTVPRLRERILDACAHCVLADRRTTIEEAELLRVVADALGCPLPPFLVAS
jgi:Zn-dependent protease with chaperone function/uncharacterized tellurite resistance protein B-like protein